jgi:hypothetical protein
MDIGYKELLAIVEKVEMVSLGLAIEHLLGGQGLRNIDRFLDLEKGITGFMKTGEFPRRDKGELSERRESHLNYFKFILTAILKDEIQVYKYSDNKNPLSIKLNYASYYEWLKKKKTSIVKLVDNLEMRAVDRKLKDLKKTIESTLFLKQEALEKINSNDYGMEANETSIEESIKPKPQRGKRPLIGKETVQLVTRRILEKNEALSAPKIAESREMIKALIKDPNKSTRLEKDHTPEDYKSLTGYTKSTVLTWIREEMNKQN